METLSVKNTRYKVLLIPTSTSVPYSPSYSTFSLYLFFLLPLPLPLPLPLNSKRLLFFLGNEMGSKGGVPPPPVVCCMCGDHGLPQELFRCKVCLLRSQHKYCSDLYPKVETYRACNWCLREEGAKPAPKEEVVDNHKNSISSSNNISSSGNGGGTSGLKLHRGAFSTQLNKPIKKQRLLNRSMSDVTERLRSEEVSRSLVKGRPVFRGKVRRYKLLEEVSS